MRSTYWSHSRFAKWVRSTFGAMERPSSATLEDWSEFEKQDKETSPFIAWFTDEFLSELQNFVMWPVDGLWDVRSYLMNRFVIKSQYLKTRLKPGQWYDFDTRLLHGMFEELVDFVEIEKAWMNVVFSPDELKNIPWWKRFRAARYFMLKQWRNPEAGLEHLRWEMALTLDYEWLREGELIPDDKGQPTEQAIIAGEIFKLYDWWKHIRPARLDPYDASGWSIYCESRRKPNQGIFESLTDKTEEERQQSKEMLARLDEIENRYNNEDTEMMHLLIDIRRSLWT